MSKCCDVGVCRTGTRVYVKPGMAAVIKLFFFFSLLNMLKDEGFQDSHSSGYRVGFDESRVCR